MPWIVARRTVRSTLRLAWTAAKRLSMPRSATACISSELARVVRHVVGHLDLAGDDVGLGRIDLRLHRRIDELGVVLVERVVDAAFLQAERGHPRHALVGAV